jgi:CDP-diacylglycerol--serine O-phosphatidyltransferase
MKIRQSVVHLFPSLITVGNGICGFAALVKVLKVGVAAGADPPALVGEEYLVTAAWLVLLGMVFDVFDGRVARLTGKTSDLGAQLDSLCDLITFGLVPAVMVVRMNMTAAKVWQNWVWFLCLLYFLGALLRLARFNVETEPDESAHLCFKGLPSPAAAGCIATVVIFYYYLVRFESWELQHLLADQRELLQGSIAWIPFGLPILAGLLGYTMVHTRLEFDHVASRLLGRRQPIETLSYLLFGGVLVWALPEVLLPLLFVGYLLYTPARYGARLLTRRGRGGKGASGPGSAAGNGTDDPGEEPRLPGVPDVAERS